MLHRLLYLPRWTLPLALSLVGAFAWRGYVPANFWSPHVFQNDARQQTFLFYEKEAQGAFSDDPIAAYIENYLPPLYRVTMRGLTRFMDPVNAGKFLHFAIFFVSIFAFAAIAYRYGGYPGAIAAALILCMSGYFHDRIASGLPRSFGYPLTLLGLAALVYREWRLLAVTYILAAGFYPSTLLILGIPSAFMAVAEGHVNKLRTDRRAQIWAAVSLTVFFVVLAVAWHRPAWIGRPFTRQEAFALPEFGPFGRFREEIDWFFFNGLPNLSDQFLKRLEQKDRASLIAAYLSIGGCLIAMRTGKRRAQPLVDAHLFPLFFLCCLASFAISWALAFRLFFPDRVVQFGVVPLIWAMSAVLPAIVARRFTNDRDVAGLCAFVAVAFGILASGRTLPTSSSIYWDLSRSRELQTARFVGSLEPSVMLAGPPYEMDWYPLMAHRKAYLTYETSHPLYTGFNALLRRRYEIFTEIYYGADLKHSLALAKQEGITHLVVDDLHFDPKKSRIPLSFEPHGSRFVEARKRNEGRWAMFPLRKEAVVYEKDHIHILDLRKLEELVTKAS